jgi:hypothetical protein
LWRIVGREKDVSEDSVGLKRSEGEEDGEVSRLEGSRAEQSRAEQSRAEQSRAEQSRAEQSRAEQVVI